MVNARFRLRRAVGSVGRTLVFLGVFWAALSCAIDPVPTPVEWNDAKGGVSVSDDVATFINDTDLAPNGAGCTCTDSDGNTYWCELDGATDASCTCDRVDPGACPEDAESCELVEPTDCVAPSEACPLGDGSGKE